MVNLLAVVRDDDPVADRDLGTDIAHPDRLVGAAGLRHRANRRAPAAVDARNTRRLTGGAQVLPAPIKRFGPAQRTELRVDGHTAKVPR